MRRTWHLHRQDTDKKPDALGESTQIYPTRFDIDISVCMSCQICVEGVRLKQSRWTTEFELRLRRTALRSAL